jgi:hypothetical protein
MSTIHEILSSRHKVRLVSFLEEAFGDNGEFRDLLEHERIDNLPTMLLRHGYLQTSLFLKSKEREDRDLLKLLEECIMRLTGAEVPSPVQMVADPVAYLGWNRQAIEAATWIRRVAKARQA